MSSLDKPIQPIFGREVDEILTNIFALCIDTWEIMLGLEGIGVIMGRKVARDPKLGETFNTPDGSQYRSAKKCLPRISILKPNA